MAGGAIHASGNEPKEVEDSARRYMEQGFTYIRCQMAIPGLSTYGSGRPRRGQATDAADRTPVRRGDMPWEFTPYVRHVPKLFEHLRSTLGDEVELLHDIHERLPPIMAIGLAKTLEPYNLFFLEDPFAPEDNEYFRLLRQQTAILGRPDGVADLSRIECPTLVLCGRQDVLTTPEVHEEMAHHIAGSTLVQIEDCGHLAPLERPAPVTAAMRAWLARPG